MKFVKKLITIAIFTFSILFNANAINYFEESQLITVKESNCMFPTGITTNVKKNETAIFYEEIDKTTNKIYISVALNSNNKWTYKEKIIGPFSYFGEVPCLYSVASNGNGIIGIAVLTKENEITVYHTKNNFNDIKTSVIKSDESILAPRIYLNAKNEFIIFASKLNGSTYSLCSTTSKDCNSWSQISTLNLNLTGGFNPIVPTLHKVGNTDLLIFQCQYTYSNLISIQLYACVSKDGCKTFSTPVLITGEKSVEKGDKFYNYTNQSASVVTNTEGTYIAFERSDFNSTNANIFFTQINNDGTFKQIPEKLTTSGYVSRPLLFLYNNNINLLYFSSVKNSQKVYLLEKKGALWNDPEVLSNNKSTYPCYVICNNHLSFAWQDFNNGTKNYQINLLQSDNSTPSPTVTGISFTDGMVSNSKKIKAGVKVTKDSSNVKGISWILTQNEKEEPPLQILKETRNLNSTYTIEGSPDKDGTWYLKVKQCDYAGNWSESASISYVLDITPPLKVSLDDLEYDEFGLAASNTMIFNWEDNKSDNDIAGYSWSINYIAPIPKEMATNAKHPTELTSSEMKSNIDSLYKKYNKEIAKEYDVPKQILSKNNTISYRNYRNGVYVFTVCAIDKVGNIGEKTSMEVIINKYIPQTYINSARAKANDKGEVTLTIIGGGFNYDGQITAVYLDKDGELPYDLTFNLENKDFTIDSDYKITIRNVEKLSSDSYKIGLLHSDRGLYFTKKSVLDVKEIGNIKNKVSYKYKPNWKIVSKTYKNKNNVSTYIFLVMLILAVAGIIASLKALYDTHKESKSVKAEIKALIQGDVMPQEKNKKIENLQKKRFGLKTKLILFTTTLMSSIDIIIFVVFAAYMISTQRNTLATSLQQRVNVMMDSVAAGSKIYLPQTTTQDNLNLTDITNQVSALSESEWCTIIGYNQDDNSLDMNYVWATNDENINEKINTEGLIPGVSKLDIENIDSLMSLVQQLNQKAIEESQDISLNIAELTKEGLSLAYKNDKESVRRRNEIQSIRHQLTQRRDVILSTIANDGSSSWPEFIPDAIEKADDTFIFYKPIIYYQNSQDNYVHGVILMQINTQSVKKAINKQRITIVTSAFIVLLITILLSYLSTRMLATLIVKPINTLADYVALIRDTQDKEKLAGKEVIIKTKDEIGVLGETVNEMTRSLVEAAIQSKNLTIGKEVQTKFIPLKTDDSGNTLAFGSLETKGANFFSFYEGADDLSGDYFDYKRLDDKHFAIIKCDVSGHGVPAALIMVEVASLFLNYFDNWDMKNPKQRYNLSPVVSQINNLLESRGFKGRFAAFTLCIMNIETGECHFCNAGDNQVQIFEKSTGKKKTVTLQETPAAGMFPSDLIEMKGGYTVSTLTLKKDDILFLYTDGIEEAKRSFRDKNYNIITDPKLDENNEELNPERVTKIIESVYNKQKYTLVKNNNPDDIEKYEFDFTTCDDSPEEAIMALVSVEKVFRMYKPVNQNADEKVKVDKKIDEFLREHFIQYSKYCGEKQDIEGDNNHIYYKNVREDPQYDDLTLIGIKKN